MIGFAYQAWDRARMVTYTVHENSNPTADRIDRAEELVFIKEGFSWVAAIFPPIWLIANRVWWGLLIYFAAVASIGLIADAFGIAEQITGFAVLALHLFFGLESDVLHRWSLDMRGWSTVGTVTGRTATECERRFFETWLPEQPVLSFGSEQDQSATRNQHPTAPADVMSEGVQPKRGWFGGWSTASSNN